MNYGQPGISNPAQTPSQATPTKANGAPGSLDQQSPFQSTAAPPGPQNSPQPTTPAVPTQNENTPSPNQTTDSSMVNWRTGSTARQQGDPHTDGTDTQPGSSLNQAILGTGSLQPGGGGINEAGQAPPSQAPAATPPSQGGLQTALGTSITDPNDVSQIQQAIHDAGLAQGRSEADLASTADRDNSYWTQKIQQGGGLSAYWLQRLADKPGQGSNAAGGQPPSNVQSAISGSGSQTNNPQSVLAAIMAQLQQQQPQAGQAPSNG